MIKRGAVLLSLLLGLAVAACGSGASGSTGSSATLQAGLGIQIATLTPAPEVRLAAVSATASATVTPVATEPSSTATAPPASTATAESTATAAPATTTAAPTEAPSDTPAPASTPTSTSTATPRTPVPAPPGPTETASPAPTSAAAPKAGSVQIVGDATFTSWTDQALSLLQSSAPTWYTQVDTYLTEILQVPTGTGRITVGTRTFQAGPDTVKAPTLSSAQQLQWYAGSIVHDSCHERLYETGQQFKGKDAEIACLKDQEAALRLITSDPFLPNYVQGLIDGADDPANQYWLNPHW
ncbi:MAG TPA: hypothetical protein VFY10_08875 [Dehalococcoidia bacterium]|nr:hypothetical protein [Dehalococcoidia bacterium]